MKRTLFLSVLVAVVALALAAGSYSALAGTDPVTEVAGVVTGQEDPEDDDVDADEDDEDGDEVDGNEVELQGGDGDSEGAQNIADVIGSTFDDASQEDVLALHEEGIGFGALYKLFLLAAANSTSVDALLDTIPTNADGKYQFAFGKMFKEATAEVSALSAGEDGVPKNLGQAKKAANGAAVAAAGGGEDDGGHGPPEHAPAHGRR